MLNLKKFKQENHFHTDEEYQSLIPKRSTKNKASLVATSVLIGGVAFAGLLVPGLLPVALYGAPLMAMSSNIALAGSVGAITATAHYKINKDESLTRKHAKKTVSAFQNLATADETGMDKFQKKGIKSQNASNSMYHTYKTKLEKLNEKVNSDRFSLLSKIGLKNKAKAQYAKLKGQISNWENTYDKAKSLYLDDIKKANGETQFKTTTTTEQVAEQNVKNEQLEKRSIIEKMKLGAHKFAHRIKSIKSKFNPDNQAIASNTYEPEIQFVKENNATIKLRSMLNLHKPTRQSNKEFYGFGANTQKEVNKSYKTYNTIKTNVVTQNTNKYQSNFENNNFSINKNNSGIKTTQKASVDNPIINQTYGKLENTTKNPNSLFENFESNFKNVEKFIIDNKLSIPINKKIVCVSLDLGDNNNSYKYSFNEANVAFAKPLSLATMIVEKMKNGNTAPMHINTTVIDHDSNKVTEIAEMSADINNLSDALKFRDRVYSSTLKHLISTHMKAYDTRNYNPTISTIDIIEKICNESMNGVVEKKKSTIKQEIEDLCKNMNKDSSFWSERFNANKYENSTNLTQNLESETLNRTTF